MLSIYSRLRGLSLAFLLVVTVQAFALADTPSCGCDELDPTSQAYQDCTNLCEGENVPVSGNIWVLVAAGAVLAAFGTRLSRSPKE